MRVDIIDDLTAEGGVLRINPVGTLAAEGSMYVDCLPNVRAVIEAQLQGGTRERRS